MMVYMLARDIPTAPRPSGLGGLARGTGSFEEGWERVIRDLPGHSDAQILFVNESESFQQVCERVIAAAGPAWNIYMLRIIAHGAPAYIQLGEGVRTGQVRQFRRLSNCMTPVRLNGRGLEIHGCNVSEGTRGTRFVQRIANFLTLPVASSPDFQLTDNRFQFEGGVTRFEPQ